MCNVLKNIQGKTAEEILRKYGQDSSVPVNLNQLLINIGISALPLDFTELEKEIGSKKGDILGLVMTKGEKAAIFYKKDDTLNRQRFTVARELAHCCIGKKEYEQIHVPNVESRLNEQEKDESEKRADIFAGELLIPLNRLSEVYMNLAVPTSITLANKFAVPVSVMEARLNYLKVSHYDKNGNAVVYRNE